MFKIDKKNANRYDRFAFKYCLKFLIEFETLIIL